MLGVDHGLVGDLEFVAERIFDGSRSRASQGNAVVTTCRPNGDDGGEVVTVGTTDRVFGLGLDHAVDRVTANVLGRWTR